MPIILVVIGLILVIYNYYGIRKENKFGTNGTFQNILKENKEDLSDFKLEIGILRKDIAESLTELQEEIIAIKDKINMDGLEKNQNEYENNVEKHVIIDNIYDNKTLNSESSVNLEADNDVISEIDFSKKGQNSESSKTEKIKNLLKDGLTDDEICRQLSVSKGEVILVRGLFKN